MKSFELTNYGTQEKTIEMVLAAALLTPRPEGRGE
jgi:hypothetical protein